MLNRPLNCAIIDDDKTDARLLTKYIEKATLGAWTTTVYTDLESAQAALCDEDVHIAFVDLDLNGQSGLDLVQRSSLVRATVPVVIVSAISDESVQEAAIAAGAYDFLPKDEIDVKTIRRTVRHVFAARRTEQELKHHANRERQGSAAKSDFLACMSHDLRTPLNAIIGFADALRSSAAGPYSEEQTKEYAGYISESGEHLLEIINTILDLAKIEQQKYTLHREWIDPKDCLSRQIAVLRPLADEKALRIVTRFEHHGALVLADPRALRQIFVNVMSNAIKFSHSGREISVETRITDAGMEMRVADRGAGMTGRELKRALTPFGQATRDPELARQGTGLGLSIIQALIKEHGGSMKIDSRKHIGTRVTLTFPPNCVADAEATAKATAAANARSMYAA